MSIAYVLLPHIHIQNANAMSSSWTVGFPAMTAWLGAVHGLERKIRTWPIFQNVRFCSTGVVCYSAKLHSYVGRNKDSYLSITRNPLRKQKKTDNFEHPPFIPEARIDLDISLIIQVLNLKPDLTETFQKAVTDCLPHMKMASGDILQYDPIEVRYSDSEQDEKRILYQLMPGYACIERRSLLQSYEEKGMDGLDALLTLIGVHAKAEQDEDGKVKQWKFQRAEPGWLVPLAVGFKGVSPLGHVKNQRDPAYPHRFAETLVTLGEFKMVHRFSSIQDILWHYEYRKDSNEYVCRNEK